MDAFFSFLKIACIVVGGFCTIALLVIAFFIYLVASPHSKMRGVFLQVIGWVMISVTGLLALYIISPIDLIPDVIPVAGWIDDAVALITGVFTGIAGVYSISSGRSSISEIDNKTMIEK
jgi:hypothetical protein